MLRTEKVWYFQEYGNKAKISITACMTRKAFVSAKSENAPKIRTTIFAVKKRQQILKNNHKNSKQDREDFLTNETLRIATVVQLHSLLKKFHKLGSLRRRFTTLSGSKEGSSSTKT